LTAGTSEPTRLAGPRTPTTSSPTPSHHPTTRRLTTHDTSAGFIAVPQFDQRTFAAPARAGEAPFGRRDKAYASGHNCAGASGTGSPPVQGWPAVTRCPAPRSPITRRWCRRRDKPCPPARGRPANGFWTLSPLLCSAGRCSWPRRRDAGRQHRGRTGRFDVARGHSLAVDVSSACWASQELPRSEAAWFDGVRESSLGREGDARGIAGSSRRPTSRWPTCAVRRPRSRAPEVAFGGRATVTGKH